MGPKKNDSTFKNVCADWQIRGIYIDINKKKKYIGYKIVCVIIICKNLNKKE